MTTPAINLEKPAELNTLLDRLKQIETDIEAFKTEQQKDGKAKETVDCRVRALKQMISLTDLTNPEEVKLWLSNEEKCKWQNTTKIKFVDTYSAFLRFKGLKWQPPTYVKVDKIPFIPTEAEIDLLISGCGKITATVLLMLKETGMRIGELCQLKWTDLNGEQRLITVTPEKGSNGRILPISDKLLGMLNQLPRQHGQNIFQPQKRMIREYFDTKRKELAERLNNPRLLKISFHTFRHWKGTMEYHKTKDIMHVKYVLGHKSVKSTEIYITLEEAIFQTYNQDQWLCFVAHNEQELINAIVSGFEIVTETRGDFPKYLRKRK